MMLRDRRQRNPRYGNLAIKRGVLCCFGAKSVQPPRLRQDIEASSDFTYHKLKMHENINEKSQKQSVARAQGIIHELPPVPEMPGT